MQYWWPPSQFWTSPNVLMVYYPPQYSWHPLAGLDIIHSINYPQKNCTDSPKDAKRFHELRVHWVFTNVGFLYACKSKISLSINSHDNFTMPSFLELKVFFCVTSDVRDAIWVDMARNHKQSRLRFWYVATSLTYDRLISSWVRDLKFEIARAKEI